MEFEIREIEKTSRCQVLVVTWVREGFVGVDPASKVEAISIEGKWQPIAMLMSVLNSRQKIERDRREYQRYRLDALSLS